MRGKEEEEDISADYSPNCNTLARRQRKNYAKQIPSVSFLLSFPSFSPFSVFSSSVVASAFIHTPKPHHHHPNSDCRLLFVDLRGKRKEKEALDNFFFLPNNIDHFLTHSDHHDSLIPCLMDNQTNIIRRTLVERGLRSVQDNNLPSSTAAAITTIARQHQDEQRELQELNAKFSVYLDRVAYLEDFNRKLSTELEHLKRTWGVDSDRLHGTYGPQLQGLRQDLDGAIRDHALQELRLKRAEYDLWQVQQQIAAFDGDLDGQRLELLKQQLDSSHIELDQLAKQFDQRLNDLARQRQAMENFLNELEGLKNELDNHQLERILLENEIQTLKEHASFQDAVYQAQRAEYITLGKDRLSICNSSPRFF